MVLYQYRQKKKPYLKGYYKSGQSHIRKDSKDKYKQNENINISLSSYHYIKCTIIYLLNANNTDDESNMNSASSVLFAFNN